MPKVCILLATFNGERFLRYQLNSIAEQTLKDWELIISDDGSIDSTKEIISEFMNENAEKKIKLLNGPQKGYVANFLFLLQHADAEYVCFADQDDVWLSNKLARGVSLLPEYEDYGLTCARTSLIDAWGNNIGHSQKFAKEPSFSNALVQCIAGGNTFLMTQASHQLLRSVAHEASDVVSHDWWTYQLLAGIGAKIIYDSEPTVLYRQHDENLIGQNQGIEAKLKRLRLLLRGDFTNWNDRNLNFIVSCKDILTTENQRILTEFVNARKSNFLRRIFKMRKSGVYRQTVIGNILLWIAIFFGKI